MKSPASVIMMPLDTLYGAVTRVRLAAYRSGWFSVSKLEAPVISVGNITTGGTGKTPLVEWVCRAISNESTNPGKHDEKKICVLTRGCGRVDPKLQVVVSNGAELLANEREAGDEPFLLAENLLGIAAVISNPDRVAAGQWAIGNLNTNVFVLDDGFQHLRLSRNLDLVVIDATNPWGGGRLLPVGRLREPLKGLTRADCIVITRTDQVEDLTSLINDIHRVVGDVPILSSRMITSRLSTVNGKTIDNAHIKRPVGAFCGIGNPESFFNHLRREGYPLSFTRAFADHHNYNQAELGILVKGAKARGAEALFTTAKDATKIRCLDLDIPCYVVEVEISIDEDRRLVNMIRDATS
ncbi:MAG: tetraacyldisaccharide 4'-kinase [Acidobacteriota bacterium]|nr:tetraacyldisaccharide 4'-kinase [Acidobacteriota bacterium]